MCQLEIVSIICLANIVKPDVSAVGWRAPGFFKLFLYRHLYVYVCVSALRLLITSGMMWHDTDPYDWLNKFYNCGLGIDMHHAWN